MFFHSCDPSASLYKKLRLYFKQKKLKNEIMSKHKSENIRAL